MLKVTAEIVNEFFHWLFNIIGLAANSALFLLILTKTPKTLRSYAVYIANFAFTDYTACFLAIFVMQRIIPDGESLTYISYGSCSFWGHRACFIGYSFMLHCYAHSLISLVPSFWYRWYILQHQNPSILVSIFVCLAFYSPSLFQAISFTFTEDPEPIIRKLMIEKFNYSLDGLTVSIFNFLSLFTILWLTIPCVPVYITVTILRNRIHKILDEIAISSTTKSVHKKLVKALVFQACLPLVYSVAVFCYSVEQFQILHHPVLEFLAFQENSNAIQPTTNSMISQQS